MPIKPLIFAALLVVMVLAFLVGTPSGNPRDTVHVVTVLAPDGSVIGHASGVMVAPQLMLTAAHVSGEGDRNLRVGSAPAKVVKFDTKTDIALLQVPLACPCAVIADTAPAVDAEAVAIGYPSFTLFKTQLRTTGHIQGYILENKRLLFSAPVSDGNSGGGLFIDGELVGIVVQYVTGNDGMFSSYPIFHLGLAVDTATMRDFYASFKPEEGV